MTYVSIKSSTLTDAIDCMSYASGLIDGISQMKIIGSNDQKINTEVICGKLVDVVSRLIQEMNTQE